MNHLILAQANLDSVPATVLKYVLIILLAFAVAAAFIYGAVKKDGKRNVKIDSDPPAEIRKAAKRFNHDLAEERFNDHRKRIENLEEEVKTIQLSRARALSRIERRFGKIWIVMVRIATKMDVDIPNDTEEDLES